MTPLMEAIRVTSRRHLLGVFLQLHALSYFVWQGGSRGHCKGGIIPLIEVFIIIIIKFKEVPILPPWESGPFILLSNEGSGDFPDCVS